MINTPQSNTWQELKLCDLPRTFGSAQIAAIYHLNLSFLHRHLWGQKKTPTKQNNAQNTEKTHCTCEFHCSAHQLHMNYPNWRNYWKHYTGFSTKEQLLKLGAKQLFDILWIVFSSKTTSTLQLKSERGFRAKRNIWSISILTLKVEIKDIRCFSKTWKLIWFKRSLSPRAVTFALYVVKISHFSLQAIAPSLQIRCNEKKSNKLAGKTVYIYSLHKIYILCKPNLVMKIL